MRQNDAIQAWYTNPAAHAKIKEKEEMERNSFLMHLTYKRLHAVTQLAEQWRDAWYVFFIAFSSHQNLFFLRHLFT